MANASDTQTDLPIPSAHERTCLVTRIALDKRAMLRFVIAPDGTVTPDIHHVLPGRGLWVTAQRAHLATAMQKNMFARGAKRSVTIPPTLLAMVTTLLNDAALQKLHLARKAGQAFAGHDKVMECHARQKMGLYIAASDGSANEINKMHYHLGQPTICQLYTSTTLGHVFGRDTVVHAALQTGRLADDFINLIEKRAQMSENPSFSLKNTL